MNTVLLYFSLSFFKFLSATPLDNVVNELNQLGIMPEEKNKNDVNQSFSVILEKGNLIKNWPSEKLVAYLGAVSGLAFCPKGFLYIFHRANVEMSERSFNNKNQYLKIAEGPIKEHTIIKLQNRVDDPQVIAKFGSDIFYLPHGIFTDKKYMITTDLARHQVLRIPHNTDKPDLILGEEFVPGNNKNHFCKPTHAVIATDGTIFVADGYCNSRIVKFDKFGKYITEFGNSNDKNGLSIPHHLVLIENKDLLCVADRENMRVQCYGSGVKDTENTGKLLKSIKDERFGPIYAVAYNGLNDMFYIVSGMLDENDRSRVFIYNWGLDMVTGVIDFPGPNGFGLAHTIDVCPKGHCLAIAGLTKECNLELYTCAATEDLYTESLFQNIWLYGLTDQKLDLN